VVETKSVGNGLASSECPVGSPYDGALSETRSRGTAVVGVLSRTASRPTAYHSCRYAGTWPCPVIPFPEER
jgi:hypothetical protein